MLRRVVAMAVRGKLPPVAASFFTLLQMLSLLSSPALGSLPQAVLQGSVDQVILTPESPGAIRSQFPKDFIWGAGSSCYQVEGGAWEDGKGTSIWDTWTHSAGRTANGDVTVDQYHHYEEDIDLIADMNMDSYRFSIAWTRIFPNGTGPVVNAEGVAYYNRLIDGLAERGLTSFVTLYHWDLPQALQDSYGGWLSDQIVADFTAFARVCFALFGDRVKVWSTFNEPLEFLHGYGTGVKIPPGLTSRPSTDPYTAGHNVLLAHAAVVDVYRREFKTEQKGEIGLTLDCEWGEPLTDSAEDIAATFRHIIFQVGWFFDPLFFGDYPAVMRELVGERLPEFSEEQVSLIKGSMDFLGLNYYTSRWVTSGPGPAINEESSPILDQHVTTFSAKDGIDIGPPSQSGSTWLYVVPWGLHNFVTWAWERYKAPIYITENGMDSYSYSLEDPLHDTQRIEAYRKYLASLLEAVREGVDVRGYYAWSLTDSFEWTAGYDAIYGLIYVDRNDNAKRYPKDSARWFSQVLRRGHSDS